MNNDMGKRELNEQREQRQTCMRSAESRAKKSKAQYIQANKDWLEAKSKEEGIMCMIVPMALSGWLTTQLGYHTFFLADTLCAPVGWLLAMLIGRKNTTI